MDIKPDQPYEMQCVRQVMETTFRRSKENYLFFLELLQELIEAYDKNPGK